MFTVMLTQVPTFYVETLPTRCYQGERPYEAPTRSEAEGYRQKLHEEFPDCTYEVQPVSQEEVISLSVRAE